MLRLPLRSALVALGLLALGAPPAVQAQESLDVTFRFIPDLTPPSVNPVRAFVPGSFNDWGPNSSGQIATGAPSQATYLPEINEYRYEVALEVGETYAYKIHYHENTSGTAFTWITDPLNEVTTGPNNDSVIEVADPMLFQLAREQNGNGDVTAVSAGLFASAPIASISYTVNGTAYADGLDHYDAATGIFRRTLPAPVAPGAFSISASTSEGDMVSASTGIEAPTVVDQARPAGLKDGITMDAAGTSATFSLYAPGKQFVYLLGDFNEWAVEQENSLFRDQSADGTWWWGEVTGLTPGEYYAFQYLVDGQIRIADPYSPLVLTGSDGFIPDAVWPDLPAYPDEARGVAGLFRAGGLAPFTFSDFERPDPEDLVVYELLVRDFLSDHSFETLADTLDYLDRLGVNAVELMPVSEFDGNESWGYNPSFHLALDKYYGTPLALKQFVEAAHQRGIAVILDVVYNHATGQSPLIQLYNEGEFGQPTPDNPYANVSATHPFNVFNDLNHESAATQRWLDQANRWWLEEYNVDGFRYDLSKGFMQTGPWDGFNQSRIDLLTRMMDEVWAVDDEAYVLLEHLNPDQNEERLLARYRQDEGRPGAMLWNKMNREYNQASMGYPTANDFPVDLRPTYAPFSGYPLSGRVAYMESHDEQWMMWRNLEFGNGAGDYDVTDLPVALERQKLAGAFFFPVPGPRMIWQFGELGYGGGPGECLVDGDYPGECENGVPGRVGAKPIRWDYWQPGVAPDAGEFGGALGTTTDEERAAPAAPLQDVGGPHQPAHELRDFPERKHRGRDARRAHGRPLYPPHARTARRTASPPRPSSSATTA